jgi:hypothetical protein
MQYLYEITRITPINDNSIKFINMAAHEANSTKCEITKEFKDGYCFLWSARKEKIKVILYKSTNLEDPIGYVGLMRYKEGYRVITLAIKEAYRNKNLSIILYEYIISKTILYSDIVQTIGARKLWVKLSQKYKIVGYNIPHDIYYDVSPSIEGTELESEDPEFELYGGEGLRKEEENILVIL